MIRITDVQALDVYCVRLTLTDGSVKEVDLTPYLNGPIFEPIHRDPDLFRSVRVDPELGTIVWDNGADICPDVLIHDRIPVAWEKESGGTKNFP